MFIHTLPVVSVSAVTGSLPQSQTMTSFWLPKVAEQGFGVPVRQIDGNYLPQLERRIDALCAHRLAVDFFTPQDLTSLRSIVMEENPQVRQMLKGGVLLSNHEIPLSALDNLVSLLLLKEVDDLESLGLEFPYERRIRLEKGDIPYLKMLCSLEHLGIIEGIIYEYDQWVARSQPTHHDVRRIVVNASKVLDAPRFISKTETEILELLDRGRRIDGDAGPLRDFFHDTYKHQDARRARKHSISARLGVTTFPRGRTHPVMMTTVVEGR